MKGTTDEETLPMTEKTSVAFDVCGPIPGAGVTVLEASAGTGKTYTIAALVARYVAEGTPLSEILAVTFTRLATGELRDRVRERLVSVHSSLSRLLDEGTPVPVDDQVASVIAQAPTTGELQDRRRRLAVALATFDEATITTTHGFCHLVLSSMGVAGGAGENDQLLEDTSDLLEEVVDDLYLRRSLGFGPPGFTRTVAFEVAREAISNPDTPLEPDADDSTPGRLRRFAELVRVEFTRRLRSANLLTYDELLVRLRDALADPTRGAAACARLAGRYSVVLVDEFQDTDPVQWEVVSRAFGTGSTALVLIGDPKQAIYSFRGADVYAYLAASATAGETFTLVDNYRSDEGLLRALDVLMEPLLLGHPQIPYRVVRAIEKHRLPSLRGAPSAAALRARVLHNEDHHLPVTTTKKLVSKPAAREWVASDLAADIVELLSSGAQLVERGDDGEEIGCRPLTPSDVAVLVRTNYQGAIVHSALRSAGVPAVVASSGNVLTTPAAEAWLHLLEALEQPASRSRAATVALGPFMGTTAEELAGATEEQLEQLHSSLVRLGQVLRRRGVSALFRAACTEGDVLARLLAHDGGERQMTDLEHVAELLSAEASFSQLGLPRLRAWLARRIAQSHDETEAEERTRRLDSDARAVQVLTVHRSKGLEFPVVYCPYMWDAPQRRRTARPVVFHDSSDGNRRKLDVGSSDEPAYRAHARACHEEERGEQLRLLYVALTRAKQQVVTWWARTDDSENSPLGRLLFSRDPQGIVDPDGERRVPKDSEVAAKLEALAAGVPEHFSVERATGANEHWSAPSEGAATLAIASLDRRIDDSWRRTSYSAITAALHEETVGSEPEASGTIDEPTARAGGAASPVLVSRTSHGPSSPAAEDRLRAPCPLDQMPAGAEVGTLLHRVLELVDFDAPELEAEISSVLEAESARHSVPVGPPRIVVQGLAAAIRTPLGPLADDTSLSDLSRADRLDELGFEFPVARGDTSDAATVETRAVAEILARHEMPGDPLEGYASLLADPMLARRFCGYMTGSIDLVLRRGTGSGARYFVADYKSNRLGRAGEALTAWHYRPEALGEEMSRFHYPLQGLIYVVALHRYLRWRMSGYDAERNLGGVLYLFLRGMLGEQTPRVGGRPCGVFAWRPSAALVSELSDLLHSGTGELGERAS
jgi:exodeoxyribonuclease V beta subunit